MLGGEWGPFSQSIDKYRQNYLEFLDFIRKTFPLDITQLMWFTFGFDVVDLHFVSQVQLQQRRDDSASR